MARWLAPNLALDAAAAREPSSTEPRVTVEA
jgi:hypothetical protein